MMMLRAGLILGLVVLAGSAGADIFTKSGKWTSVGPNPCAIAAGDLNGDGRMDLVTADVGTLNDVQQSERPANDELSVLLSQEDFSYVRQPLRVGFGPYSVDVTNMDNAKAPDIVVGCFQAVKHRDVILMRNIGNNLFEPKEFRVPEEGLQYFRNRDGDNNPLFPSPGITSILVRDFNQDGFKDVLGTGWCSDVLVFFPGMAENYLGAAKTIDAPGGPRDLDAYDFNKDGKLDLATTMYSTGEVALWEGDGKGWFGPKTRFSSRGQLPHKIRIADMNKDGNADLVVSQCFAEDSIVIFYGEGGFDFTVSQEVLLGESREVLECEIRDIVVDDFDGNGRTDIAAACYGSGSVAVLQNVSDGSGVPQKFHRENYTFEDAKPRALCVAELNNDGAKDIAVALWQSNSVAVLYGPSTKKAEKTDTKSDKAAKTEKADSKTSKSSEKKASSDSKTDKADKSMKAEEKKSSGSTEKKTSSDKKTPSEKADTSR